MIALGGIPNRTALTDGRVGVRPAEFGTGGSHPNPLLNDVDLGDDLVEFALVVKTLPSSGTLTLTADDGSFVQTGPDGVWTWTYDLYTYTPGDAAVVLRTPPATVSTTFGNLPAISGVSPTSGVAGASIVVSGTDFGTTQGASTITVGGTAATVTSWSASSITITAPAGTGAAAVIVTTSVGASNSATFTYQAAPAIISIAPTSGPIGTAATITGTGFQSTQGASTVTVGGASATVTAWASSSISITIPSGTGTATVVVTTAAGASNAASYTYTVSPSIPAISGISPTSGIVGASVTISGTDFGSTQGSSTVTFGGTAASVTSWSAASVTVTAPAGTGSASVVLTTSAGASNAVSFTYTVAPTVPAIAGISPASGVSGAQVVVSGTGFGAIQGSSSVTFGGVPASVIAWSDTSIAVVAPPGAGSAAVVVTTTSASNSAAFAYVVAPPVVTDPGARRMPHIGVMGGEIVAVLSGSGAVHAAFRGNGSIMALIGKTPAIAVASDGSIVALL